MGKGLIAKIPVPRKQAIPTQLSGTRLLAAALVVLAAYLAWKVTQSGEQALQFAFNGLAVGAAYAVMAMGFTLSLQHRIWFFDLYYGAAAALGAYGVFYLRSNQAVGGQYGIDSLYLNIVLAVVVAGVAAWSLRVAPKPRVIARLSPRTRRAGEWALASGAGVYTGLALTFHEHLYLVLSPAVGLTVALLLAGAFGGVRRRLPPWPQPAALPVGAVAAGVAGAWAGFSLANAPGANLYASWGVSCLLAGAVGLAGGLFASWATFIDPNSFVLLESVLLVAIVILGGPATIWGSLLGAMVFVLLEEGMRFLPFVPPEYAGQARQIVLGALLVWLMLFRPQGLMGKYRL